MSLNSANIVNGNFECTHSEHEKIYWQQGTLFIYLNQSTIISLILLGNVNIDYMSGDGYPGRGHEFNQKGGKLVLSNFNESNLVTNVN